MIISYMLKIVEREVYYVSIDSQEKNIDLRSYYNCVWITILAMTTVGYGDVYPKTNIGRLINMLAAILGTIIISMMVISLQNFMNFYTNEGKAYNIMEQEEYKNKVKSLAAKYMSNKLKYFYNKSKYEGRSKIIKNNGLPINDDDLYAMKKNIKGIFLNMFKYKRKFCSSTQ